jgi:hypothetical protein
MKELVQKKGKEFRKYAFGKYGLNAETLVLDCHQSKFIKYEDIGFNETITKKSPSIYKILLVVSLFFNLILIFLILALVVGEIYSKPAILIFSGIIFVVLSIFLIKSLLTSSVEKQITGPAKIEFNYEKRDREKVDTFIANLNKQQRDYMRKKYMRIDQLIPAEQQSKVFLWLFNRNFITYSELEVLLEETEKLRNSKEK